MPASWIMLSPDGVSLEVTTDRFSRAVEDTWPGQWEEMRRGPEVAAVVDISPPGDTSFQIFLFEQALSLSTDGTWPQAARVAAWARSLLPEGYPARVWMIDQGYTGHVDLPAGVTAEQVAAGWLDHAVHGEPTDVA